MKVIKFGGTSLKDVAAIQNVIGILDKNLQPCIIVLSATAGTTNKFLEMIELAASGDKERAFSLNRKLEKYHLEYIRQLGMYNNSELKTEIKNLFSNVETFLTGLYCIREAIQRVCDAIVSNGELISTKIVAAYLKSQNKKCRWFDVREIMITDNQFGSALPDILQLQKRADQKLKPLLSDYDIIVTQGFIGMTAQGLPTTLGRGGSDYTASLIGEALEAESIEIWTDVSGVMTADPRIIESAYTQPDLSFKEAAELAYFGARVLHPSAILPAIRKHIPVLVKNTLAPNDLGTKITPESKRLSVIKAIAFRKNISIVTIESSRMLMAYGFLEKIFDVFSRYKISVDLVSTSEISVSLTIDNNVSINKAIKELQEFSTVKVNKKMAIVSLVAENIKDCPNFLCKVFQVLEGISIEMITFGASNVNLSFVTKVDNLEKSIRLLHKVFFEQNEE